MAEIPPKVRALISAITSDDIRGDEDVREWIRDAFRALYDERSLDRYKEKYASN